MEILGKLLIKAIKIYKYLLSPLLFSSCRYLPTCSEYFIDCIKINGPFKGSYLGIKRILTCHPIKFLGAGQGFDPAPNLKEKK
tara:strand:- start:3183 stop:3431 length:249 start_codon:yes stop_codon:yes gene_type:complete